MKTVVKIFTLVLAAIFVLSSTALAMPSNTVVIGNKAYSVNAIFNGAQGIQNALNAADGKLYYNLDGQTNGFVGLFDGQAMTESQKSELKNIEYIDYDSVGKVFTSKIFANFENELSVVSAAAVDETKISITFNDGVSKQFTVNTLAAGNNTRTITYLNKSFTVNVTYVPAVIAVQEVKRDNYRHFQVIFTGMVDLASAKKAENYYFFINEGNADYKSVLPPSNQLDTIAERIDAKNVNGKTVVDIYLPEDNRFTNIADFLPQLPCQPLTSYLQQIPFYSDWIEPYGFDIQAWLDDEESIIVNKSNDVHGSNNKYWALTAGRTVQVGVRNVRDLQLMRSIDTAVMDMEIKDDVRPDWIGVNQVDNEFNQCPENYSAVPEVPVYTDGSQMIRLSFNEPVFNTHGLGVGDINNHTHYNIKVAVDDTEIASTDSMNIDELLSFYMDAEDTYSEACLVDFNVKAAIEKRYTDGFRADNTYNIKITGITDLAGNITSPQVLEFKVNLRDPNGSGGTIIPAPKILDVKQIHDNIFRVYMNRNDVIGVFEIRNGDGEDGLIKYQLADFPVVPYSRRIEGKNAWYRDVIVPAADMEISLGIGVKDDQLLAYDRQNTLKRTLRVSEVATLNDSLTGNSFECSFTNGNEFTINKDIYAPEIIDPSIIKWNNIGSKIVLNVKDIVPATWATDDNTAQPVYAMLYDYKVKQLVNNAPFGVFDYNSIDTIATEAYNMPGYFADPNFFQAFDLLPITVSYTKDGVTRTAVISNRNILEESANYNDESGRHYGAPYSLTYDFSAQKLIIDLAPGYNEDLWYKDLLDGNGKLIQGIEYKIQIPGGYFADQARFNTYNFTDWEAGAVDVSKAAWFVPKNKVLYVSDDRNNNSIVRDDRNYQYTPLQGDGSKSYMVHGYTSAADEITQAVEVAPVIIPEPKDAVPQTSKELINWNEDRDEIWVEFTGPDTDHMDKASLKNPANYILNDMSLADMGMTADDIEYVVSNENIWNGDERQFAQIKLPFDTITVDGDYLFKVSGVSNIAGGTMTPVEVRLDVDENFRPIIVKALVIGNHEIELTFNESVRYIADPSINPEQLAVAAKDNFIVKVNGAAFKPMSATVGTTPLLPNDNPNPTYPLNKIVRLNLGSVELLNGNPVITIEIVKNQNNKLLLEDCKCNPLNDDAAPFTIN